MPTDLDRLFRPSSVAVVGATPSAGKPGRIVLENLLSAGARPDAPRLYGVHPTHTEVLGVPTFPSIDALPETVDVVVLAVSAEQSVSAAESAIARGVPFVIVLAGGFGEAGEAGRALEARLVASAAGGRTRLLGPNTLGIQAPHSGLDTVFVRHAVARAAGGGTADGGAALTEGGVALVSQSGSVAVEALGDAAIHGFPLRAFVGLGNAADLATTDFIDYFRQDHATRCICVYLEHLGEGRTLLEAAREAARRIPVFFLKAGRTAVGAAAVASHTGRLAGSDRVVDAALAQYGIGRVVDDEALMDAARAVSFTSVPKGNRVAILTPAGGYGVMGSDYLESIGGGLLTAAELSEETRTRLSAVLLPFASAHNPVDLTAGATNASFAEAVRILLGAPEVDILVVMAFLAPAGLSGDLVGLIADAARGCGKTLLVFCRIGDETDRHCRAFTSAGLAAFNSLPRTIRAARFLIERRRMLEALAAGASGDAPARPGPASDAAADQFVFGPAGPTEADVKALLASRGLAVPRSTLFAPDAAPATGGPGFPGPYAVKVVSPEILHKTEAGALRLGVTQESLPEVTRELAEAFSGLGILVEEMVGGVSVELIAGAIRDPDLGLALMVGAGGVLAELYRDVAFRLLPCGRLQIEQMLDELAIAPLLSGYRGLPTDRAGLVDWLETLSVLITDLGDRLAELDVNPLAYAKGRWVALDAKIVLRG